MAKAKQTLPEDVEPAMQIDSAEQRGRDVAIAELRTVFEKLLDQRAATQLSLIGELTQQVMGMQSAIEHIQQSLTGMRAADNPASRIMAATGELGAIVSTSEQATFSILDAAQKASDLCAQIPDNAELGDLRRKIDEQVTNIMMACSFQDLTGQRTAKVVSMLQVLEERLNNVISLWNTSPTATTSVPGELEGPQSTIQSAAERADQDAIDALLNG